MSLATMEVSSGSWWWTGKPGVLQSMWSQEWDTTEWLDWAMKVTKVRCLENSVCRWSWHAWCWVNCLSHGNVALCCSSPSPPSIRSHNLQLLLLDLPGICPWVLATSTLGPISQQLTSLLLLQMKVTYQLSRANVGLLWWLRWWRICLWCRKLQCGRPGFDPWVRRIPWRREWLPTPGFLPGESQGQKSLPGYSACSHKESDTTQGLTLSLFTKDASQFSGSLVSLSCRGLSLNENWVRHSLWGLLRKPCRSCLCVSRKQQRGWVGSGEIRRGSLWLTASFVLASLFPPTPVCHQWQESSVYFVEVLHPLLKFFWWRYLGEAYYRNKSSLDLTHPFWPWETGVSTKNF